MELINKRYKILKNIKQSRLVSSYLATDEKMGLSEVQLNIINSEYLPENLLNFYIKEFYTLATIENSKHVRLYDFDIINYIDNKKMDKRQYFYTNELVQEDESFFEHLSSLNEQEQLELIIKLCQGFHYLHLRGFIYGDININNILFYEEQAKIKDLATKELEKYDYWSVKENQLIFKAPEILEGKSQSILSDIYSLGVLISFILMKDSSNSLMDIQQAILRSEADGNILLYKLSGVLGKMLEVNLDSRYQSIWQIIEDINYALNTNFIVHNHKEIEKINFSTKLVGRDYEINNILNLYSSMAKLGTTDKFVIVHGEYGVGKTRLLQEAERLMLLQGITVFSSYTLRVSNDDINKGIYEIIKKLTLECDADTLERYEGELIKLIPELAQKKEVIPYETLGGDREKLKVIGGVCDFINDCIKGRPIVFIIDNIHRFNDFSLELLEHLYLRSRNLMVIFSYCDGEFSNSDKLSELISKLSGRPNISEIVLHGLEAEDSVSLIQDLLRMPYRAKRFAERIYTKAYGNPLFIEEILKNLLASKAIYIDEHTGRWNSDSNDYSKLPMPINMEQAVLAQIKDISNLGNDILQAISIFNAGIPEEVITNILVGDYRNLLGTISVLEAKGIICKKIEDSGFVYDFSNRILKNIVKDKLNEEYRRKMHKVAALLLEKQYEVGIDNKEELIYHLEMAGQKEKVIKYCLDNADKMEAYKNRTEAIKNLKHALSVLDADDEDSKRIELLLRIGSNYAEEGFGLEAINYFGQAGSLAQKQNNDKLQIIALNKLINVYLYRNELAKANELVLQAEKLLIGKSKEESYLEVYLISMEHKVRLLNLKQDYKQAADLSNRCISLCKDDHIKLKGLFYKNLGNIYLDTAVIEEAIKSYSNAMDYFQKINHVEGILVCMNNLAVAYGDYYQDNEMAIRYFEDMKEISERNHIINYQIMALTNLASSYCYEFKYELALQYFLESLEKSKKIDYEANVFYCYNYLTFVCLGLQNYKQANKYLRMAQKELEIYPDHGKEIGIYYHVSALFYYTLGSRYKARSFIDKALEIYNDEDSINKLECQVLKEYIALADAEDEQIILEIIGRIKKLSLTYKSLNLTMNILYSTAVMLFDKGYSSEVGNLLDLLKADNTSIYPAIVKLKADYVKALLGSGEEKAQNLTKVLGNCVKDRNLYWKVCYELGYSYLSIGDYFNAANYFLEAAERVRNLTMQLPEKYRIKFIHTENMLAPFKMLALFVNHDDYREFNSLKNNIETEFKINRLEELNSIFSYEGVERILKNKYFESDAAKVYSSDLPFEIKDTDDIIKNLYSDPLVNMEIILKYISKVSLATRSSIIVDGYEKSYYTVCSNDGKNTLPSNKLIFERVKAAREPLLIKECLEEYSNSELNIMLQDLKAVICIPIIMRYESEGLSANAIKGYIYLETDRILNNFNEYTVESCTELSRLVGVNLERYQLKISSSTDKLTGTLTRKYLEEALSEHIEKAETLGSIFSIVMMDMDHFKHVNDRFGHQAGDEVLKEACSIIKANLPKEAVFGRYGGEEFIILLPETDAEGAFVIADELRRKVGTSKILGDKTDVTVSMGISTYPHSAEWKEELIEKADQALYISKELGRNQCQVWTSEFASKPKSRNKLSGIVSGNLVQDSRNVLVMIDIIDMIKQNLKLQDKIYNILGRIIEITESQKGWFFLIENNKIKEKYSRKLFCEEWVDLNCYNKEIVNSVISKKQGVYMTDWNESENRELSTEEPMWNSVAVVPLIKDNIVKGVLYLSVPTKKKEFKFDEYNFINTLGELTASIL